MTAGASKTLAAAYAAEVRNGLAAVRRAFGGAVAMLVFGCGPADAQTLPLVLVRTTVGDIVIEVDSARAPITAANFLRYVDEGFYDGGRFFRTVRTDNQPEDSVRIAVIQAGARLDRAEREYPPIPLERTTITGLRHRDGAVSMARGAPNSATSSFFICVGDQPALDFGGHRNPDGQGFAAFGRVVSGDEVVKQIHAAPARSQNLRSPAQILEIRRLRRQHGNHDPKEL